MIPKSNVVRVAVVALSLSAAGFATLIGDEDYVGKAMVPTKGDRWTVGFGSTFREDGTPVQPGDTTTPVKAISRTLAHVAKDETGLKKCITAPLHQVEYDTLVNHSYQFGVAATCSSGMVKMVNAGRYTEACAVYLQWKKSQGRDCSDPKHWGPRGCKGVWTRAQARYEKCMSVQIPDAAPPIDAGAVARSGAGIGG